MLKKNNKNNEFHEREKFNRNGTDKKHQDQHRKQSANDWQKTPEWAVNYATPTSPVSELISLARKMERLQQIREENLGDDLWSLGEPAWKILIQLFIATEEGKSVSLLDISDRVSLPETIAIRYVNMLEKRGHIVRLRQSTDRINDQLQLTDKGQSIMRKTLLELDKI